MTRALGTGGLSGFGWPNPGLKPRIEATSNMQKDRNSLNASPERMARAATANVGQSSGRLFHRPAPVGRVDIDPLGVLVSGKAQPTP